MSNIISFNGIEIRRIENKLSCSCPLGRGKFFNTDIYIPHIRDVIFNMNETNTIGQYHALSFYVNSNGSKFKKQINLHTPTYIVVTEKEADDLLNNISELMENK